jgi:hypothetical protein
VLVVGSAALLLGLLSAALDPPQPRLAAQLVPVVPASLRHGEQLGTGATDLSTKAIAQRAMASVPVVETPGSCGAPSASATFVAACTWRNAPDRDLRLYLATTAVQQRGSGRARRVPEAVEYTNGMPRLRQR